jgi:hypothetical protein
MKNIMVLQVSERACIVLKSKSDKWKVIRQD